MSLNILFIDDDIFMLKALQRAARRLRPGFHFWLCDKENAWQHKLPDGTKPDAVFCDFLMPLKNGDKVLGEIEQIYPSAVRILLTGNTTEDVISIVSNVAHFVLCKPFVDGDLEHVFSCIERLNMLPFPQGTRDELGKNDYFFSLPEMTTKIQQLFSQPEINIKEAAKLIEQDSVMTAKIIQMANSAFLGYRRHTASLTEAITRLGLKLAEAIVVSMSIEQKMSLRLSASVHQRCSNWAYRYASLCRQNSSLLGLSNELQEIVSVAALLTGLGHFTLASESPDYDPNAIQATINYDSGLSSDEVALRAVYLLTLWGFSFELCEIILQQDTPNSSDTYNNCDFDSDKHMLSLVMFVSKLTLQGKVDADIVRRLKSRDTSQAVIEWLDKVC
jgi:HD-like signal output (HDOD) protein